MKKHASIVMLFLLIGIVGCGNNSDTNISESTTSNAIDSSTITEEVIKDTTPPDINIVSDNIIYLIGDDDKTFSEYATATDAESDFEMTIDTSKVDYEKQGKYNISFSAIDSSGNKSTKDVFCYVIKNYSKDEIQTIINNAINKDAYSAPSGN